MDDLLNSPLIWDVASYSFKICMTPQNVFFAFMCLFNGAEHLGNVIPNQLENWSILLYFCFCARQRGVLK